MAEKIAPLSGTFLIASIVLFFVSILQIYPWNKTWGFTLILFSIVLFTSSLISMEYSDAKAVLSLDHIKLAATNRVSVNVTNQVTAKPKKQKPKKKVVKKAKKVTPKKKKSKKKK